MVIELTFIGKQLLNTFLCLSSFSCLDMINTKYKSLKDIKFTKDDFNDNIAAFIDGITTIENIFQNLFLIISFKKRFNIIYESTFENFK
ncbi:MAG: hypothetical protein MHPSP_001737, partial [Paramarteilia canceri]